MESGPAVNQQQQQGWSPIVWRRKRREYHLVPIEIEPTPPRILLPGTAKSFENVFEAIAQGKPLAQVIEMITEVLHMVIVDETMYSITTPSPDDAYFTFLILISNSLVFFTEQARDYFASRTPDEPLHMVTFVNALSEAAEKYLARLRGMLELNKPDKTQLAMSKYGFIKVP
ncbi:MAG: hypothetical protein ACK4SY_06775 [Pyrobaculum sp.]